MKNKLLSTPKAWTVFWLVMTAAYAVWMLVFMKPDTYTMQNTLLTKEMYASPLQYYLWVAASVGLYLLYPLFIAKILFAEKLTKANKLFNLISLIAGCAFITYYGFLMDPIKFTASMMGLYYPWLFKLWCVFSGISVFTNTLYMYRKNDYMNRTGILLASVGCAALFVTVNIPSAGEDIVPTLQCIGHWTSAFVFAVFGAAGIVVFLVHQCLQKNKRYIIMTAVFVGILLLMLILLVVVGKSALIENLPMWAAYLVLFLVNFTSLFDSKAAVTQ